MAINHETVLSYLVQQFDVNRDEVQNDTPLFTSGLLDSFSVGDLLVFLEEQGEFVIEAEDVVPENLDSLDRIVTFASRKSSAAASA